ncbi:hypothetical protein GCM10027169_34430 [Gordonia jinhuaensis]|uniref:Uncharacterized protein n=1 Tax=Gordonia jinhuaensis TaxID=1517702 RepID=A0A916WTA7_9ACTN|nr:hypothetical protein [Gordonia jinhuaensis]GGB30781.1 hypothetical protein GCM10011489_18700 [Gordonia jinhuaensis]
MIGAAGFVIPDARDRADALAFVSRTLRIADNAVTRLRRRDVDHVELWGTTGFDVLVSRVIAARLDVDDLVCDSATLADAVRSAQQLHSAQVDPGFPFDSAWPGALPPRGGTGTGTFTHVDDLPARTVLRLAREGAVLAREENSGHGPAAALLDQPVLSVHDEASAGEVVEIPMRALFALAAMGFVRDTGGGEVTEVSDLQLVGEDEPVRVRVAGSWGRIDARYGSVFFRRTAGLSLDVV